MVQVAVPFVLFSAVPMVPVVPVPERTIATEVSGPYQSNDFEDEMVDAARRPLAATARGRRKALLADGDGRGQTERGAATAIGTRNWTAGRLSTVVVGLATGQSMRLQLCGEADASPEAAAQRHSSVFGDDCGKFRQCRGGGWSGSRSCGKRSWQFVLLFNCINISHLLSAE